jgi:hypothetical protein
MTSKRERAELAFKALLPKITKSSLMNRIRINLLKEQENLKQAPLINHRVVVVAHWVLFRKGKQLSEEE